MNYRFLFLFIFLSVASIGTSQDFSDLDKSPMDAVMARAKDNSSLMRIIYSRPYKRNRKIFGKLVALDTIWRTGANEATEIRFYKDVLFNGEKVEKGTYTLFTIPHEKEWTIIINEVKQSWGLTNYSSDQDLLRTKVKSMLTAVTVEQFSISIRTNNGSFNLLMGWDDRFILIPILPLEDENDETSEIIKNKKYEEY